MNVENESAVETMLTALRTYHDATTTAEARETAQFVARRHAEVARLAGVTVLTFDVFLTLAHARVGRADRSVVETAVDHALTLSVNTHEQTGRLSRLPSTMH